MEHVIEELMSEAGVALDHRDLMARIIREAMTSYVWRVKYCPADISGTTGGANNSLHLSLTHTQAHMNNTYTQNSRCL